MDNMQYLFFSELENRAPYTANRHGFQGAAHCELIEHASNQIETNTFVHVLKIDRSPKQKRILVFRT